MQWSDVIAPPSSKKLRQFSVLWLVFFVGLGVWRGTHGQASLGAAMAAVGVVFGALGLVQPLAMRPIYTGWMIAAFPIGWTISRIMLAGVFFFVFAPVAALFKLIGRDALRLAPRREATTYWTPREPARTADYFRQF